MIYVMSDIHGNLPQFRSVMEQIRLGQEDTLFVLGDVMDRYPDGVTILQELMAMPNAHLLLGNHDYMMLQVMDPRTVRGLHFAARRSALPRWFRNGGEVTKRALEALPKAELEALLDYVRALPLYYDVSVNGRRFRLIHAAPMELYDDHDWNYGSRTEFAVWYRWPTDEAPPAGLEDRIFVFGHSATCHFQPNKDPMQIFYGDDRIGIDCGAGYPRDAARYGLPRGRLACLRLDDLAEFYANEDAPAGAG